MTTATSTSIPTPFSDHNQDHNHAHSKTATTTTTTTHNHPQPLPQPLSRTYEFDSHEKVKCHVSGVYHVTAPRLDPDYDVDTYDVTMTSQTVLVPMTSR